MYFTCCYSDPFLRSPCDDEGTQNAIVAPFWDWGGPGKDGVPVPRSGSNMHCVNGDIRLDQTALGIFNDVLHKRCPLAHRRASFAGMHSTYGDA